MSHSLSSVSTSAFEILGPIMVGPSSSHTAGAVSYTHLTLPTKA